MSATATLVPDRLLARLACPACRASLTIDGDTLRCTDCGHVYPVRDGVPVLFPGAEPAEWTVMQQALYDGIAAHYDGAIPEHVAAHYRRKRVGQVRALAPPGSTVLDSGCGTGTLASAMRDVGYDVYGVDASVGMLAQMGAAGRGLPVAGFMERLPIASDSFDLAITVATLHHITDPERVAQSLAELCRVVRPGGCVVVWDHNPKNPYWPYLMKRIPQDTGDERLVPQEEIVTALLAGGGVEITTKRSGLVPEFVPPALMPLAMIAEAIVERTPCLNIFCAHNIVIARKRGA